MIECKECGHHEYQILSHLREEHGMDLGQYFAKHGKSRVMSRDMQRFLQGRSIVWDDDLRQPMEDVDFMGITARIPLRRTERVPGHDPDYLLPEKTARELVRCIVNDEKVIMVGPTGAGKSTLVEQVAHYLRWPVVRVSMSSGLTEADLLGEPVLRNKETVFSYGFLPQAMQMGAICLLDELDGMEPSVGFAIHQVLEDQGNLTLLQNGAEIIHPHPMFRVVGTANTLGQ